MAKSYDPYKGIRPKPAGGGRSPQASKSGQTSRRGGGPEDEPGDLMIPGLDTTVNEKDLNDLLSRIDDVAPSNDD